MPMFGLGYPFNVGAPGSTQTTPPMRPPKRQPIQGFSGAGAGGTWENQLPPVPENAFVGPTSSAGRDMAAANKWKSAWPSRVTPPPTPEGNASYDINAERDKFFRSYSDPGSQAWMRDTYRRDMAAPKVPPTQNNFGGNLPTAIAEPSPIGVGRPQPRSFIDDIIGHTERMAGHDERIAAQEETMGGLQEQAARRAMGYAPVEHGLDMATTIAKLQAIPQEQKLELIKELPMMASLFRKPDGTIDQAGYDSFAQSLLGSFMPGGKMPTADTQPGDDSTPQPKEKAGYWESLGHNLLPTLGSIAPWIIPGVDEVTGPASLLAKSGTIGKYAAKLAKPVGSALGWLGGEKTADTLDPEYANKDPNTAGQLTGLGLGLGAGYLGHKMIKPGVKPGAGTPGVKPGAGTPDTPLTGATPQGIGKTGMAMTAPERGFMHWPGEEPTTINATPVGQDPMQQLLQSPEAQKLLEFYMQQRQLGMGVPLQMPQ